jgi:predicted glycosyltransferase/glycosyltransferase involved in cell wall biosynthesis
MKVLHVLDFTLPHRQSGYSLRSKSIVDTQNWLGMEPVVLTRSGGGAKVEAIDGVPYWRNGMETYLEQMAMHLGAFHLPDTPRICRVGQEIQFGKQIASVIEAEAPEVIHVASPERNARVAIDVGHRHGLPVVYEVRGLWHESSVAQGWIDVDSDVYQAQQTMHVQAMQDADVVVTLSEVLKAECVLEGIDETKIFVVPNGVSEARCVVDERCDELAQQLGIGTKDVVLGYVGLVRSLEGLEGLLAACQCLQTRYGHIKILIVGGGRDLDRLKREAQVLGIGDRVIFTGEVPHEKVDAYYSLLDVVVIPRTRGRVTELVTPLKPYEAMAKGKALVVSDVAALREMVIDGETGLVCRADDVDDLTRVCGELIGNAPLRQYLGDCGRAWVRRERTWETVVKRYESVYDYAVQKRKPHFPARIKSQSKQIAFYSQHLVGVGHHFRNREIVGELSKMHDVLFLDGGRPIPGADLAEGVTHLSLPPLRAGSNGLMPEGDTLNGDTVLQKRQSLLTDSLMQTKPDVFLVEFFPFCRWSLRGEIVGAIETAMRANPNVKVVCSLRDVPTRAKSDVLQPITAFPERHDGDAMRFYSVPFGGAHHEQMAFNRRYYEEVVPTLNAYFDAVLVHGDPKLSRLEDHFPWVADIGIPVVYTGFVAEKLGDVSRLENMPTQYVLVSAGGGAEGLAIGAPCIEAWKLLDKESVLEGREMVIFAGAFIDETHFEALRDLCGDGPFRIERFTSNFLAWMKHADLSISRAGYNTCMNVLETKTPSILVPSIAMDDQEFRAQRLMNLGISQVIHPDQLSVTKMAKAIQEGLRKPVPEYHLAMDGAEQTRKFIESL